MDVGAEHIELSSEHSRFQLYFVSEVENTKLQVLYVSVLSKSPFSPVCSFVSGNIIIRIWEFFSLLLSLLSLVVNKSTVTLNFEGYFSHAVPMIFLNVFRELLNIFRLLVTVELCFVQLLFAKNEIDT